MADGVPSEHRSLITNSRWNLIAFACSLGAQFFTVPFVIRWIGLQGFGMAGLVLAISAPLTLVGTVLGQAVTREASVRLGGGDIGGAQRIFDTALCLCFAACCAGLAGLTLFGPRLLALLAPRSATVGHTGFALAAVAWAAQQGLLLLQGSRAAYQDFGRIACLGAICAILTVALTLLGTWWGRSVDGYLGGVAASFCSSLLVWCWALRPRAGSWRRPHLHAQELASLLRFGKWQTLAHLAGSIGNQMDRYALGAIAPAAVVGQYNAANRLQEAVYMGVMKAGEILFPHFGATSGDESPRRQAFFLTSSWIVITAGMMMLAPLGLLAHSALELWVSAEAATGGSHILRTLVSAGMVGCASNVFTYYAMGIGQNAPVAWISLIYATLTVLSTIALLLHFGPAAAGGGLLVASTIRVVLSMWMTRQLFFPDAPWMSLLVCTLAPLVAGLAVVYGLDDTAVANADSWPALILDYAVTAGIVLVSSLVLSSLWPSGRAVTTNVVRAAFTQSWASHGNR